MTLTLVPANNGRTSRSAGGVYFVGGDAGDLDRVAI